MARASPKPARSSSTPTKRWRCATPTSSPTSMSGSRPAPAPAVRKARPTSMPPAIVWASSPPAPARLTRNCSGSAPTAMTPISSPATRLPRKTKMESWSRSMTLGWMAASSSPPNHLFVKSSDECHGAGSSPPLPPDFHRNLGARGNEVPATKCKKGFVEKHGRCVRKPKPRKHRNHHQRRLTHHRGGKK